MNNTLLSTAVQSHATYQRDSGLSPLQVQYSNEISDPQWDAFLAKQEGSHVAQSALWGELKAHLGWQPIRITVRQNETICGGAQLLVRSIPYIGAIGHVPKGPLVRGNDPVIIAQIITLLHEVARRQRVRYLLLQPPDQGWALSSQLRHQGFQLSSASAMPTATVLIDLHQSLDEILAQMKKKTRYGVRRSAKDGITVRDGDERDLPMFHGLLAATSERQNFTPFTEAYFVEMWRIFGTRGHLKLLIAEYEGKPISAQLMMAFGNTVAAKQFGWSGEHGERRPNEALDWATIQWAKAAGYRYYDLEGIHPAAADALRHRNPIPQALTQTPTSYKVGFGGEIAIYPGPLEYIYNPLLRFGYTKLFPKIRNWPVVRGALSRFRAR